MKSFAFILILFLSCKLQANINNIPRNFSNADEINYSLWIKEKVSPDIFLNPESIYYGIKTDCADAAFALRAIFAFENNISFQFINNEGKALTNSDDRIEKLKSFIASISQNAGSETLASDNTYPVDLKSIRSGDLYITKWKNPKGQFSRHVYIIKDVLPTGDFLLYSSTTPLAVRLLLPRKGMPTRMFTEKPFGFRRFKYDLKKENSQFDDFSNFQYEAMKYGEEKFFKLVKDNLKTSEDTLELNIEKYLENICVALDARISIIEAALEVKRNNSKNCFNKESYDQYSSPSRDRSIVLDIERLRNGYKAIVKKHIEVELDNLTRSGLDYLIAENKSEAAAESLRKLCPIIINTTRGRVSINIKLFYDRYKADVLSSNPNDVIESRWGLIKSENKCPIY